MASLGSTAMALAHHVLSSALGVGLIRRSGRPACVARRAACASGGSQDSSGSACIEEEFDIEGLVRPHLKTLAAYKPIEPFEVGVVDARRARMYCTVLERLLYVRHWRRARS